MRTKIRKSLSIIIACILSAAFLLVASSPVAATGYVFRYSYYSFVTQVDARIGVDPIDPCPNTGNVQQLKGVLTDSSSTVFTEDMTSSLTSGWWGNATFLVPSVAALGTASFTLECYDGATLTRTFDAQPLEIVAQTTDVTVDDEELGAFLHVYGATCSPGVTEVEVYIVSQDSYVGWGGAHYINLVLGSGANFNGGDGTWYTESYLGWDWGYEPGYYYYLQSRCKDGSGNWYNPTSLKFQVTTEPYVVMGDSYSSGEGSFNYDLAGEAACHRSTDSYAYYLADNIPFDGPDFAACSGAVTDDLYNAAYWSEPSQINRLSDYTQVITLTIGGNDVGFVDAVNACANYTGHVGYSCAGDNDLTDPIDERLSALAGTAGGTVYAPGDSKVVHPLEAVLTSIATKAPNAEIYIAGYPHLFGASNTNYDYDGGAPGAHTCTVTNGTGPVVKYAFWDAEWLNDTADALNQVIEDAVDAVQPLNVTYVPPSEFDGHGLCDDYTPYLNGVEITGFSTVESESLHPNVAGMHLGYGVAFENAIN